MKTYPTCRLHGELAATVVRDSAAAVQQELLQCYALIERLGRGVVYYGSARLKGNSAHWDRARTLGRQVAQLLGCTTWSGGGPGMMEAATLGERKFFHFCHFRSPYFLLLMLKEGAKGWTRGFSPAGWVTHDIRTCEHISF